MTIVVQFECKNVAHRARAPRSIGGLVIRHGTLGYCEGAACDNHHQWVATGGVSLDSLIARSEGEDDDRSARTRYVSREQRSVGPLPALR